MRRLILMRHAKSSWADPGQRDLDRPLNKRGRRAPALIGGWLKHKGYRPGPRAGLDARGARRRPGRGWSPAPARRRPPTCPEIYHAAPETLLDVLQGGADVRVRADARPPAGDRRLRRRGCSPSRPADPEFDKYPDRRRPPSSTSTSADWSDVGWGAGRLVDFVVPRALE